MAETTEKAESDILGSVHTTATGLHNAGIIDPATMREFDVLCLAPERPMAPGEPDTSARSSTERG